MGLVFQARKTVSEYVLGKSVEKRYNKKGIFLEKI